MQKLIKLSESHYIIVDDSEINIGDWCYGIDINRDMKVTVHQAGSDDLHNKHPKVIYSTQPLELSTSHINKGKYHYDKIKNLELSEVEEAINGYSVEKMAKEVYPKDKNWRINSDNADKRLLWIEGFKAHQELVKDMVSLSEVFKILDLHTDDAPISYLKRELEKKLLPKTEWTISIDENNKITLL